MPPLYGNLADDWCVKMAKKTIVTDKHLLLLNIFKNYWIFIYYCII